MSTRENIEGIKNTHLIEYAQLSMKKKGVLEELDTIEKRMTEINVIISTANHLGKLEAEDNGKVPGAPTPPSVIPSEK